MTDSSRGGQPIALSLQRLRGLAAILVVFAAVLGAGLFTPNQANAVSEMTVATDALNLRVEPHTSADVITKMYWGEPVEVLDGPTGDGWYYVAYAGETGWAFGEYLAAGDVGSGSGGERWIDVDRSSSRVTLYEGDVLIASYWAAMGWDQTDDGYYATAIGTYHVYDLYDGLSWSEYGQVYFTYWVGFDPERRNGLHTWSLDENGNQIPGGDTSTGGCVSLEYSAAKAVYDFAEYGMRVEVHW